MGVSLPLNPRAVSISGAAKTLRDGGIALLPTETCYGLSARADLPSALERLHKLKGRDAEKPFLLLVPDVTAMREAACGPSTDLMRLIDCYVPGPLTLVLKLKKPVGPYRRVAALRAPSYPFLVELLNACSFSLVSTSANQSGEDVLPYRVKDIPRSLREGSDLIVDAGTLPKRPATTILDASKTPLRLLREGGITRGELERILEQKIF